MSNVRVVPDEAGQTEVKGQFTISVRIGGVGNGPTMRSCLIKGGKGLQQIGARKQRLLHRLCMGGGAH
jgi:hypothetical protein